MKVDLFSDQRQANRTRVLPLAARMRPTTLDEFVGQQEFLGPGKLLRRMLEADRITSALFYGPPGTGKTSLAHVIAGITRSHFESVNAVSTGVKEVREILRAARDRLETGEQRTILFVDELHRFNRAQQDVLLGDVEEGIIILLGATTENPFFAINTPLISRSQIFQFVELSDGDITDLLNRAVRDKERGFGTHNLELTDKAAALLVAKAGGDARRALTALEVAVLSQLQQSKTNEHVVIDEEVAAQSIQRKAISYDAAGDNHYDTISAMIKSIRAGDPDSAVYWLARMLEGGEDPRYIARRIVIAASEDVGNADPNGLVVAQAAAHATQMIGLPECQLPLAQAAIYLACAPKSNACARAVWDAAEDVRTGKSIRVPKQLQSSGYRGAGRLGAGEGYVSPHDDVPPQGSIPPKGEDGSPPAEGHPGIGKVYYTPKGVGAEANVRRYLENLRQHQTAVTEI